MTIEYKLRPVTDTSWILHQNGTRLAMIIANSTGYTAIGSLPNKHYSSLDDLSKKLGGTISIEEVEKEAEPEIGQVEGYPIKHSTACDITNDVYPSYAKTNGSSNRFAAGYYGILFSHGWVGSYCPKISTLEDNTWIGPFRTKLEMLSAISAKKKEPKL